ncbi:MAG TPA: histidine triad nucleotide-binding protein [Geobacteraceae bacterium]|nr:histidine triad nucleotide-binding protein [Geobacteraceae bacterium]
MDGCLFCRIVREEIPAKIVYKDEQVIAIEDIAPVAPTHVLIIPRKHFVNALDLDPADNPLIGHIYQVAARIAREREEAGKGFRIVCNNNAGAGQSVFHIHFHLLAGRQFNWPPG